MSVTGAPQAAAKISSATPPSVHSPGLCLYRIIEFQAAQWPDAVAFAAPGRAALTYTGLRSRVEQTVENLNSFGIGRSDRVAAVLSDGPEAAVALLGIAAGSICAPLNPRYRVSEFDFYLRSLNAKALIVQSGIDSPARAVAQNHGIIVIELSPLLESEAGSFTLFARERAHPLQDSFAEGEDVAIILQTSGTTSRSKLVPLTQANIYAAASKVQAAFQLVNGDRYLNVTPLFYSQGVMLTVASIYAGASVVCPPGFSAGHFLKWMEEFRPTWYSAAPTVHQAILAHARYKRAITAPYSLRFIRSAAAPLPSRVRMELEKLFRAPVIESYGMTECYPVSSNPLPPRKRKPGSAGLAAGTEIAVIDDDGRFLHQGETGEIVVSGDQLMSGYLNAAADRSDSFVDGWFRTGDQGYLDKDGYLFVTGRVKEIINRGGEKISPREIDEVLLEHGAVSEAVTFSVPHATLGEDVAAAVVLRDGVSVSEREIQDFVAARLAPFKVPRLVHFLKEIPKTATGKTPRIGLAEKLGLIGAAQATPVRSAGRRSQMSIEERLIKIWGTLLGVSMVSRQDNFFDLGGNSLLAIQLLAQIEEVFGKELPWAALFQAPTVEQLASVIQQETSSQSGSSLVPVKTGGSRPPFFWVHRDSSTGFLTDYLGADQPFYALEHQALDGKLARYTGVEAIAAYYVGQIRTVQLAGPYFLGGFSFGGTIAFEMAQQLIRQGEEVGLLFLLDSHFPGADIPNLATGSKNQLLTRPGIQRRNLAGLRAREKLRVLLARAEGRIKTLFNSRKTKIDQVITNMGCKICFAMGRPLPVAFRSSYILNIYQHARLRYQPQIYPGGAIYIKSKMRSNEHQLAWSKLMLGGWEVYEVPGDHLDVIEAPYLHFWAERLKAVLTTAQESATLKRLYGETSLAK